jgi:hypothetical protein
MIQTTAQPVRAGKQTSDKKTTAKSAKPKTDVVLETKGDEVHLRIDKRHYRIRGLEKNHSSQQLKVNILARRDEMVHLDTLDLFKSRSRNSFIKATASELFTDGDIIKRDIGTMLLKLEQLQHEQIEAATQSQKPVEVSVDDQRAAMKLLKDPKLVDRIVTDFDACGLAGEETNKLVCYLASISRRLKAPLALLIQSGSAAGKTTLMDAALSFVPDEDQIRYSAMTGQSLYYMGETNIKHKILAISEEEGVAQASYALKLLQSDGKLTIAAVGKNSGNGRQSTDTYEVEGPVMMFLTTTAEHPDPELQNRCITLRVNESSDQTAEIHNRQRIGYMQSKQKRNPAEIRILHQNAQRLLASLPVIMPWAQQLTFRHDQTRMRRDNAKYLSLIASITLLHQHQRKLIDTGGGNLAVESTIEDVELANRLVADTMGNSLDDLLPQTRQLLVLIDNLVNQESQQQNIDRSLVRFTQRQLRESFGWSDFQIRHHLKRLIELEYALAHRTGHGNAKQYELLYDGQGRDGESFLLGLAEPAKLKQKR